MREIYAHIFFKVLGVESLVLNSQYICRPGLGFLHMHLYKYIMFYVVRCLWDGACDFTVNSLIAKADFELELAKLLLLLRRDIFEIVRDKILRQSAQSRKELISHF